MGYQMERFLKLQSQLTVAKVGFTIIAEDQIARLHKVEPLDYESAAQLAEELNSGYELIKELESQIAYFKEQIEEKKEAVYGAEASQEEAV